MKLKAILFDLDDTLIDLREASLMTFNKALESHGLRKISMDEMLENWCKPWIEVIKSVLPSDKKLEEILPSIGTEYIRNFMDIHLTYSKIYPEAYETISQIHGIGLKIGIVSRRPRVAIEEELQKFGLNRFVEAIVGSDDTRDHKPSPGPVILAAKMLNVLPGECVLVGDSPEDVKAGERAGTSTISVMTGPCWKNTVEQQPEIIIGDVSYLIPTLKKLGLI